MCAALAMMAAACDAGPRPPDANAPALAGKGDGDGNRTTGEIAVRVDASLQRAPSISVLAFRAAISGIDRADVLGIVDPLSAAGPEHDCALRDVDLAASALLARGGSIELQEMSGIGVGVGMGGAGETTRLIRPFPRLYPDVATVVGGVVAESATVGVDGVPERLSLVTADSELAIEEITVPSAARIISVNGNAPGAGLRIDTGEALVIGVAGGAGTTLEIRPFGATVALACALGPAVGPQENVVIIPRAQLGRLFGDQRPARGSAVALPASLDVVKRNRVTNALLGVPTRLSVEVRSSMTVELVP